MYFGSSAMVESGSAKRLDINGFSRSTRHNNVGSQEESCSAKQKKRGVARHIHVMFSDTSSGKMVLDG